MSNTYTTDQLLPTLNFEVWPTDHFTKDVLGYFDKQIMVQHGAEQPPIINLSKVDTLTTIGDDSTPKTSLLSCSLLSHTEDVPSNASSSSFKIREHEIPSTSAAAAKAAARAASKRSLSEEATSTKSRSSSSLKPQQQREPTLNNKRSLLKKSSIYFTEKIMKKKSTVFSKSPPPPVPSKQNLEKKNKDEELRKLKQNLDKKRRSSPGITIKQVSLDQPPPPAPSASPETTTEADSRWWHRVSNYYHQHISLYREA